MSEFGGRAKYNTVRLPGRLAHLRFRGIFVKRGHSLARAAGHTPILAKIAQIILGSRVSDVHTIDHFNGGMPG